MSVILITGASRGIGAATARMAAKSGYAVAVNYRRRQDEAEAVVAEIETAGGQAVAIQADVSLEADVARLFDECDEKLGSLSALVNNAGVLETQRRVEQLDRNRLERIFATNVFGTFACCRHAVQRMSTTHGGSGGVIVNVSSVAARTGAPGEYVDYAASKGAMDTLTIGLAHEVAQGGIRVNGVRPGFIYTDMHADGGEPDRIERVIPFVPLRRGGTPEEVASAILWLVSDNSSFTTGAFIEIAGGR